MASRAPPCVRVGIWFKGLWLTITQTASNTMSTTTPSGDDGLFQPLPAESAVPAGVDRRGFFMRNAVIGAAAALTGAAWTPEARAAQAAKEAAQAKKEPPKLGATSPDLDVVKKSKGPVMILADEFY